MADLNFDAVKRVESGDIGFDGGAELAGIDYVEVRYNKAGMDEAKKLYEKLIEISPRHLEVDIADLISVHFFNEDGGEIVDDVRHYRNRHITLGRHGVEITVFSKWDANDEIYVGALQL